MKKIFAFAGLMTAAVISLTNCQPKELGTEVLPGKTFTIAATTQMDTKTTNDGMSTLWEAADSVNVFFGESAAKGTIQKGAGSKQATFEIAGTAPSGAVDWYLFFPYNSHMTDPNGTAGYNYIGHSKGLNQDGFDNMSALRGNVCPMYGVAEGKTADEVLVTMKQLTSVIEFNLTNNTGSAVVVNSISLNATEDIVGTYYINFASDPVVYTSSGDSYVYNTATVNIEDGSLNNGESGKAYLPIKPYTHDSSKTFDVTVNCTVGDEAYSEVISLSPSGNQCVFAAGKIKKVNLNLNKLTPKSDSIADAHTASSGTEMIFRDVLVASVMKQGFFITDNTDILLVFLKAAPSVTKGQKVTVEGKITKYQGNKQVNNDPAPTITANGTGSVTLSPVTYNGAQIDAAYVDNNAKYVKVEATATSTTNLTVEGAECVLYVANNNRADGVTISKDKTYILTGYVYGHGTYSGAKQVYFYAESAEEKGGTTANLSVSPTSLNFTKDGGSEEVTVTCDNTNWTIDSESVPTWLTATKGTGKITFKAAANEETKRSATVKINHSNGTLSATVKVSQEGAVESDSISLSPASLIFDATPAGAQTVEVTSNVDGWTWDETTVADWITLSKSGNNISVSVQTNTGEARNCTVKVVHANGTPTANLVINQRAKDTGSTVTYTKVTSGSIGTGDYLIVYEEGNRALDGSLTDYSKANFIDVTISGGKITASTSIAVHYDASAKRLQTASGYYLTGVSGKNNVSFVQEIPEGSASDYDITISYDSASSSYLIGCSLAAGAYVLRYNVEYQYFRFYKTTSSVQTPIQLYKKN